MGWSDGGRSSDAGGSSDGGRVTDAQTPPGRGEQGGGIIR
jgi:hypothetical protein